MSLDLIHLIHETISETINQAKVKTKYHQPLVGFAAADDSLFDQIHSEHILPTDLLPNAKTIVVYFLPFQGELAETNRQDPYVARQWADAYIETNGLLSTIACNLQAALSTHGVMAAFEQPTHNFDTVKLRSRWSHKSAAYIAGLGTFGLHSLLITPAGCAGRFGSLVLDREIPPTPRPQEEFCLYRAKGACLYCVRHCPSGALTEEGLNKQKCYAYVQEVDLHFSDLGSCQVCGKCATGPCGGVK
ncbi:MAG: epoxyqueuosine reductase [Clostridia bacterium]|nr:epoxyqueuosine reductase [Clostridia bacterium]